MPKYKLWGDFPCRDFISCELAYFENCNCFRHGLYTAQLTNHYFDSKWYLLALFGSGICAAIVAFAILFNKQLQAHPSLLNMLNAFGYAFLVFNMLG